MSLKPVTIIGGGLAGLTLGIGLRRRGIPVMVFESGDYPRHRVCGEFICGAGQDVLTRFGLMDPIQATGAIKAHTAKFFFSSKPSPPRSLPLPAICVSRYELDELLSAAFEDAGGKLYRRTTWREKPPYEGVVWASGRRAVPVEKGWRWFGLKAHASNVELTSDLEMHCYPQGYIGICRLRKRQVNICGLFRRPSHSRSVALTPMQLLQGPIGSTLHQQLEDAHFIEGSICSVAGLRLQPQRAAHHQECCIGDALTMIAPVTGNGMSMAFEAAEMSTEPLVLYSQGRAGWAETQHQIAELCDSAFKRRLFWANWVQRVIFATTPSQKLGRLLLSSQGLWRLLFARTR